MKLTVAKNCKFKLHRTALTLPAAAATGSSKVAEFCFASDTNVSTQLNRCEWAQVLWSPWLLYLTERVTRRSEACQQYTVGSARCWYWYADNGKQQSVFLPACVCVYVRMSCATPSLADSARRASDFCCVFVAVANSALGLGSWASGLHNTHSNMLLARWLSRKPLMFNALLRSVVKLQIARVASWVE